MKRKVIRHSPTSLVLTIPTSWARKKKIKKGDELEIIESGGNLVIHQERKKQERLEATVDIRELDRTTILYAIRNLYRAGYDKVTIHYDKMIPYSKENSTILATEVIHRELRTLLGFEITSEQADMCVIENISEGLSEEMIAIVKRIYLLIINIAETMLEALKKHDVNVLRIINQRQETIIRFINYCLRTAAKKPIEESKISNTDYYRLANMERICRLLTSSAERVVHLKKKAHPTLIEAMDNTLRALRIFNNFRMSRKSSLIPELNKLRYKTEKVIFNRPIPMKGEEDLVLFHLRHIHHLLLDVTDVQGLYS